MGFAEVLPRLPRLRSRLHQTLAAIRESRPRVVLGIDSKAFCLRLLRALADERAASSSSGRADQPSLIQYVAPSVWAFRDAERRASNLAGWLDELLLLLPFERPLFERAGVRCTFVGHPSLEDDGVPPTPEQRAARAEAFCRRHALSREAPTVCLLPGSRAQELDGAFSPMRAPTAHAHRPAPGAASLPCPRLQASCRRCCKQRSGSAWRGLVSGCSSCSPRRRACARGPRARFARTRACRGQSAGSQELARRWGCGHAPRA